MQGGLADELFDGVFQGGLVERGVPDVERGTGIDRHRVGAHQVKWRATALRLTGGPAQGSQALIRTVHTHDNFSAVQGHGVSSFRRSVT